MDWKRITFLSLGIFLCNGSYALAQEGVDSTGPQEEASSSIVSDIAPQKDLEQLDFANGLFQRKLYVMAIAEYDKFIKQFPESSYLSEAYFGLAESQFFEKKYNESVENHSIYIDRFPEAPHEALSVLRIGQALFFKDNYQEALLNFLAVNEDQLSDEFLQILYFYTGKTYQIRGEEASAIEFLEKTTTVNVDQSYAMHAFLELGNLASEQEDFKKAYRYYSKAHKRADTPKIKSLTLYKQGEMKLLAKSYDECLKFFLQVTEEYPKEKIASDAVANLLLALFHLNRFEELVTHFDKHRDFIKQEAVFFDVFYITAYALANLEQYDKALTLLDQVMAVDSVSLENKEKAFAKKSEILVKAERFEEMVALTKEYLVNNDKTTDQILFLNAEAYYGLDDFASAYNLYKQMLLDFPESPFLNDAIYGMAHSQNALGEHQDAMTLFSQYYDAGNDEEKRNEALYNEIIIGKKLSVFEQTIKRAHIYLKSYPEDPRAENILFLLGTLYPKINQFQQATSIFKNYIARYPKSLKLQEAYFLLAFNLQASGQLAEALAYYQYVKPDAQDNSLYYSALKNTALIYLKEEEQDMALMVYDRIITEFDKNDLSETTISWLIEQYFQQEQYDDVLRVATTLEAKNQNQVQSTLAYYKAISYQKTGQCQEAIVHFDMVLGEEGSNSYNGPARIQKGICLRDLKEYVKAREEFDKVLLEFVEDATISMRARFEIAELAKLKGDLEEASKFYMLVAVLYNDDAYSPQALYQAGVIFEELNKRDNALNVYQEILSQYQESAWVDKAKERLKVLGES